MARVNIPWKKRISDYQFMKSPCGLPRFTISPAIRIERVVDNPLRLIVFVVVLEAEVPKAFGDSFEARTLG